MGSNMPPSMPQRWLRSSATRTFGSVNLVRIPFEFDRPDVHRVARSDPRLDQLALHPESRQIALEPFGRLLVFEVSLHSEPFNPPPDHAVVAVLDLDRK